MAFSETEACQTTQVDGFFEALFQQSAYILLTNHNWRFYPLFWITVHFLNPCAKFFVLGFQFLLREMTTH